MLFFPGHFSFVRTLRTSTGTYVEHYHTRSYHTSTVQRVEKQNKKKQKKLDGILYVQYTILE